MRIKSMQGMSSAQDRKWDRHDRLPGGLRIFVRKLRPDDAALYPDFLAEVTAEDMRLRFLAPMRELRRELIAQLTHLDPRRAAAFVALDEETGKLLGVARLHYENGQDGEYAILIRSKLKGLGLGWHLMNRLVDYARALGLQQVHGLVLPENAAMLKMCGEFGFKIADDAQERGVKRVTFALR
jgi:acetyltransferase